MKHTYFLLGICLVYCLTACKPDFNLNAPYKDVTVVYGILDYNDSIHYVKIYKGYQSNKKNGASIEAQNPESIYYYDNIKVVLREYKGEYPDKLTRTLRADIPMNITNDFPTYNKEREPGFFYSGEKSILYCTKEKLSKEYFYKIVIENLQTGKITEGITPILGNGVDGINFEVYSPSSSFAMKGSDASVSFYPAKYAKDYEFHVNFVYFEVDNATKAVVKIDTIVKNVCPQAGEEWHLTNGYYTKKFIKTFYDDIAARLKPNSKVTRYIGTPGSNGVCIMVEGWAAGESMVNYLLSNKPTSSFIQVNTIYTNLAVTEGDGLAFGFFSSRVKTPIRRFATTKESEDSLYFGSKTYNLGFRPWEEYNKP